MAKKHTDNIDMSFTAEEVKVNPITTPAETYEKEGKIIYKKDETGYMQFIDGDNNPVSDDTIEKLADAYKPAPTSNDSGDEQEGEKKVRYIKQTPMPGAPGRIQNEEVGLEDCDIIEERTYYKNGEAMIQTIPKRHLHIIKYLRGEYDEEDAKEVSALDKIEENKDTGKLYPVENQEKSEEG